MSFVAVMVVQKTRGMTARRPRTALAVLALALGALLSLGSAPALAAEAHPFDFSFGAFSNPNGLAVDEATGDVYVADIDTNTVYKFDAGGNPVDFAALGTNALTGAATPAGSFAFPISAEGTPASITVDNSRGPNAGDLYVMDAGHQAVDKFGSDGTYVGRVGSSELSGHQLLGVGVDGDGNVRVAVMNVWQDVYVFDGSSGNWLVRRLSNTETTTTATSVFAADPVGSTYLRGSDCVCLARFGRNGEPFGRVDEGGSDIAAAVDPATRHLYIHEGSAVSEWDIGGMNGPVVASSAALVDGFGSAQLSSGSNQGGIAVNGKSGEIYVSNPADGKVYAFASDAPGVAALDATDLTTTSATLHGTVDPRGEAVASCRFEYKAATVVGGSDLTTPVVTYRHEVPCDQSAAQIGTGDGPVAVSAHIDGLEPGKLYHFRLVAANANVASPSSGMFATKGTGFGIKSFQVAFLNEDGTRSMRAGSHPDKMAVSIEFNTKVIQREPTGDARYVLMPDGNVRDVITDLPPGLVGDPNATPAKCTLAQIEPTRENTTGETECPPESQVGILEADFGSYGFSNLANPLYNMVPPPGVAAQIGGNFIIPAVFINNGIYAGGEYPLRSTVTGISAVEPTIASRLVVFGSVGSGANRKAFLTLPTRCNGPLKASIWVDSYQEPGHFVEEDTVTKDATDTPVGLTDCAALKFHPTISVKPDSADASTPSGLTVGLNIPQQQISDPNGRAESALRDTTVALPEGIALNPSSANGLEGCSEALAGFKGMKEFHPDTEPGEKTATFTPDMPDPVRPGENFCPNGSKIGTVSIDTPLLSNALSGGVYLAEPFDNPFDSLVAIYMFAEDESSGTLVKLAGRVQLTASGQIVTTFENTPDLPFEDLKIHFFGGERAPLVTPSTCGTFTTQATFTPWSGTGDVTKSPQFQITSGPGGSACANTAAEQPHKPSFSAGTVTPIAGNFSPFVLKLSREDGSQQLKGLNVTLPPGLIGKLAGIPYCPDPNLAAAANNTGTAEQAAPSCPAASQVGTVNVGAGAGSTPFHVGGTAYLAGPYKGAPLSVAIVTPAVAGPYDLGTVVVRAALSLDPTTAQVTVKSDPLPTILQGIPLDLREIRVNMDRNQFTLNPTSCDPMSVDATVTGTGGASANVSDRFQVGGCAGLPFAPKIAMGFTNRSQVHKRKKPGLDFKLSQKPGEANIQSVTVKLPRALVLDVNGASGALCEVAQAENGTCPASSIVGHATAVTPLLDQPLTGAVYFVRGDNALPNIMVALRGQISINLHSKSKVDKMGRLISTFGTVPDAPISQFHLTLGSAGHGVLSVAPDSDLCTGHNSKGKVSIGIIGQNGKSESLALKIKTPCKKARKHKR